MKHRLPFLLALSFPISLLAQTWGPGTTWTYYQYEFFEPPHTNTIQIVQNVDVNGLPAFQVTGSCYCGQASVYLRKEGTKVYFFEHGEFYLLYDFSLNAGDTLKIYSPQVNCQGEVIRFPIDSISHFQTLDGQLLKVQHLGTVEDNCALYFGEKIIENIGSDYCLFPQSGVCDPSTGPLLCFETQAGVYYPVPGVECISGVSIGNNPTGVRLYPTVIQDRFTLESNELYLRSVVVYRPDGSKVYEKRLSALSETLAWPEHILPGIYFIEVWLAGGSRSLFKVSH